MNSLNSDDDSPTKLPKTPPHNKETTSPKNPAQGAENNPNKLNSLSSLVSDALHKKCMVNVPPSASSSGTNSSSSSACTNDLRIPTKSKGDGFGRANEINPDRPVFRQLKTSFDPFRKQPSLPYKSVPFATVGAIPKKTTASLSVFKNIQSQKQNGLNDGTAPSSSHVMSKPKSSTERDPSPPPQSPRLVVPPCAKLSIESNLSTSAPSKKPIETPAMLPTICGSQPTPVVQFKVPVVASKSTANVDAVEFTSLRPRPMTLLRTNSAKSKSEMRAEFQSNAVLFHTPSTLFGKHHIAHPELSDDSIDLSLNDSVLTRDRSPMVSVEKQRLVPSSQTTPAAIEANPNVVYINKRAYVLGEQLGIGGSSVVYAGSMCGVREPPKVAVKVVDLRGDSATVRGYINETELLVKLQGNSCVIGLLD